MYDLYEKVNDTCYIDAVIYKAEDKEFTEKELEIIEEYKNKLIERLKNVKIESNIYYSIYVSVFHGVQNERNILVFNEDEKYATVKEDFYNKIYATVLNAQRDLHTEDKIESKINVLSENMIGANVDQQRFDIETGRNFDELMQELEKQKQEELEKQRQEELQNQIQNQNQVTEQTENTISNNVQNQVENETENSVNNTMTEGTNNTTTNTADNTNQTIDAVITF